MAFFSSSTSRALIDRETLRLLASIWVILASTFSPTANRSGRWSARSRAKSFLRMKPVAPSASTTSRSEEHTSELQSLMRISYAVFCLKKKKNQFRGRHSVYSIYQTNEDEL